MLASGSVRIGVTPNKGAKKPQAEGVGTLPRPVDFQQLTKFCKSKLKLKSGASRIFVCRGSPVKSAGFEILDSTSKEELNAILVDGVLLAVSAKGADYNDAGKVTGNTLKQHLDVGKEKLALPPRSLAVWLSRSAGGQAVRSNGERGGGESVLGEEEGARTEPEATPNTSTDLVVAAAIASQEQTQSGRAELSALFADRAATLAARERSATSSAPLKELEMNGLFPYLPRSANVLQLMQSACVASAGFVERFEAVKNTAGIVVFDYIGEPTPPEFPDPCQPGISAEVKVTRALQREARGLVLCAETGAVLARRFHKFFNLNERVEVCLPLSDATLAAGVCKEKLDGCLCSPVLVKDQVIWCTRRVRSAEVEAFVQSESDFEKLARYFLGELNATPLFEWCPSTHVVGVLRHEKSRLVLLSVRSNSTGQYLDSAELDNFVAERFPHVEQAKVLGTAGSLMHPGASGRRPVSEWTGLEGVVIAMESGARYKLKSDWYVSMAHAAKQARGAKTILPTLLKNSRNAHGTKKEGVALSDVPAEHVWIALLAGLENPDVLDDLVASCAFALSDENGERRSFLEFVRLVQLGVEALMQDFWAWAQDSFKSTGSVDVVAAFAENWQPGAAWVTGGNDSLSPESNEQSVFAWPADFTRAAACSLSPASGHSAGMQRLLLPLLVSLAKKGDVATVEALLGVQWRCGAQAQDQAVLGEQTVQSHIPDDLVLGKEFGDLDACPADSNIPKHVCEVYAPRKIAQLTGKKEDITEAYLHLERKYRPAEGKIPGLWEQFKALNVWDLRVDLQGMCREGPTCHEGSPEHALLLVQFGLTATIGQNNPKGCPKGNLAGVLVPTAFPVSARQIVEGLRKSFDKRRVVLLQRHFGERDPSSCTFPPLAATAERELQQWFGERDPSSCTFPPPAATAERELQRCFGEREASSGKPRTPSWQLFCDLDGTLADFDAGVVQWTGKAPKEQLLSKMWAKLLSRPGFFEGLPWMQGAAAMWGEICDLMRRVGGDPATTPAEGQSSQEPTRDFEEGEAAQTPRSDSNKFDPPPNVAILTGVPGNAKKHVHREKHKWCEQHLQARGEATTSDKLRVVTCTSQEKHAHGGPRTILIDDTAERRKEWAGAGGVFIHHVSAERTMYELRRTVGLLGELPGVRQVREHIAAGWPLASLERLGIHDSGEPLACASGSEADSIGSEVTIVTAEWPPILEPEHNSRSTVVGIDCEWATKRDARCTISLVQIAVSAAQVFVVDLLCASACVKEKLRELCADDSIVKVGFALENDVTRTQVDWHCVVDMQEAARDLLFEGASAAAGLKGSNLSFADLVKLVLGSETVDGKGIGKELNKEKRLQHSDWEVRPLSDEQMHYAALDAAYALCAYKVLRACVGPEALPSKRMFHAQRMGTPLAALRDTLKAGDAPALVEELPSRDRALLGCADDCADPCAVDDVIYTAVFLAPLSRRQLLRVCPPKFCNVHADHVTLWSTADERINVEHLRSLPIGSEVNLEVDTGRVLTSADHEPAIEALCVLTLRTSHTGLDLLPFVASKRPHVTLSAGAGVRPAASVDLMQQHRPSQDEHAPSDGPLLQLRGVVGLVAHQPEADELAGLQPRVAQRIRQFCAGNWVVGDMMRFAPGELTSADRKVVHGFAETHSLESRSEGWTETAKRLILVKKRRQKEAGKDGVKDGVEMGRAPGGLRVFQGGNEAIDEKADLAGRAAKRTRRVTDKSLLELGPAGAASGVSVSAAAESGMVSEGGGAFHGRMLFSGHDCCADSLVEWDAALVDGDPIADADVIVLRGLPGAGKSTLSRWLRDTYGATVCTADEFFERGAGLSAREVKKLIGQAEARGNASPSVYHLVFSEARLPDAHRYCRERFEEALAEHAASDQNSANAVRTKIVLDNVNSCITHYAKYVDAAKRAALQLVIVELVPSSGADVSTLNRRSLHAVPVAVSHKMHAMWETDARAYRVRPLVKKSLACTLPATSESAGAYLAQDELLNAALGRVTASQSLPGCDENGAGFDVLVATPAIMGPTDMSFQAWLSANHLLHCSKSRVSTHLQMAVGTKAAMFLSVPAKLRAEFLHRYSRSCGEGERNYLVELVPTRSVHAANGEDQLPLFRMFFDIDFPEVVDGADGAPDWSLTGHLPGFIGLVRLVQHICGGGRVIVTGVLPRRGDGLRPGLHLRLPDTLVTQTRALELHTEVIGALQQEAESDPVNARLAEMVDNNWQKCVDAAVYRTGAGLRMLGSRKVTKGVDHGRVYEVLCVLESDGSVSAGRPKKWSEVRLQEQCSMHASDHVSRRCDHEEEP